MSVVPLIFRDWWDDLDRPVSRLMDQHFGRGLNRDDLISRFSELSNLDRPLRSIFRDRYYRPWRNVVRQQSGGASTIQIDGKDNFQVSGHVQSRRRSLFLSLSLPSLLSGLFFACNFFYLCCKIYEFLRGCLFAKHASEILEFLA